MRLVLGHTLAVTGVGLVARLLGSLALTRSIGSLLYGITPHDGITYVGVSVILTVAAAAASFAPPAAPRASTAGASYVASQAARRLISNRRFTGHAFGRRFAEPPHRRRQDRAKKLYIRCVMKAAQHIDQMKKNVIARIA